MAYPLNQVCCLLIFLPWLGPKIGLPVCLCHRMIRETTESQPGNFLLQPWQLLKNIINLGIPALMTPLLKSVPQVISRFWSSLQPKVWVAVLLLSRSIWLHASARKSCSPPICASASAYQPVCHTKCSECWLKSYPLAGLCENNITPCSNALCTMHAQFPSDIPHPLFAHSVHHGLGLLHSLGAAFVGVGGGLAAHDSANGTWQLIPDRVCPCHWGDFLLWHVISTNMLN